MTTTTLDPTTANTVTTVDITRLRPNPDNPRTSLGSLDELTRSIKAHGVLQPLLVLPADAEGLHIVIAGNRRLAACLHTDLHIIPVVVRDLTPAECIEVALSENSNRDPMSLTDEIAAIERLMSLADGLTPVKLSKRIGKSQAWVRDRMAVTILPVRWRQAIGDGGLSLTAASAAASLADLGPDRLASFCELLSSRSWRDPRQLAEEYRRDLRRQAEYEIIVARHVDGGGVVFHDANPAPSSARRLSVLGFDDAHSTAHLAEPCHAVIIAKGWGDSPNVELACVDPKRHRPSRAGTEPASPLAAPASAGTANHDDSHAKRRARLSRVAHGTDVFAQRRGGFTPTELTSFALGVLIDEAGHEALKFAAQMLGEPVTDDYRLSETLAATAAESPAELARIAGAVACGIAESRAYHSTGSSVRGWFRLLATHGWEPDPWTNGRMHHQSRDIEHDETADSE